ncbi:MAG: YIP1 family protein [Archaeoglobaceae archaeon]|nr:YIP1 family protein [Archaeoglobaceae archaeon]MDW7990264.1 YIP1 family protein [Archaeoglobaceae archaeon]
MDFLVNPDKFFAERKAMGFKIPIVIVTIYAIISAISANMSLQFVIEEISKKLGKEEKILLTAISAGVLISAFIGVYFTWFITTGVLYLLSILVGGRGSFGNLAKFIAFSFIPLIFLSPIETYLTVEFLKMPRLENFASLILFLLFASLWQYVYWVFALKNARELSLKRSAIVSAIPIVISLILGIYSIAMQGVGIKGLELIS